uniref:tRNA(Ile)-lysidine synthase, chloroplastic n=1 Tax=Melanthalia intermedia TaxID=172989 RepID=A0A345UAJ7_9FLOR|nr:tRNAIle-lysidine synthetase [Melanthalia intermedia]AXI97483.1 tRNAIle-lysidine synthetase [Melanthalia intermedia]
MTIYLNKKFENKILTWKNLYKKLSAIAAVSGGQDSMCLVKFTEELNKKNNYFKQVEYIYIDHQWRSDCEHHIKHLLNYLNRKDCKISVYQINNNYFSELTARRIRYHIIVNHALNNQQQIVLTGHNQTDQTETFFLNLIRGAGMEGITSLNFNRKLANHLTLLRPLIKFKRSDISWFYRRFCLPIWSDETNFKYKNSRNRIRNELLPYLSQYFGLQTDNNISHFLNSAFLDSEYIKQNSIKLYIISRHKNYIAINFWIIKSQHKALQTRVLQIFFYHHFNSPLSRKILNQIIKYVQTQNSRKKKKVILWRNLTINIEKNWLYVR